LKGLFGNVGIFDKVPNNPFKKETIMENTVSPAVEINRLDYQNASKADMGKYKSVFNATVTASHPITQTTILNKHQNRTATYMDGDIINFYFVHLDTYYSNLIDPYIIPNETMIKNSIFNFSFSTKRSIIDLSESDEFQWAITNHIIAIDIMSYVKKNYMAKFVDQYEGIILDILRAFPDDNVLIVNKISNDT